MLAMSADPGPGRHQEEYEATCKSLYQAGKVENFDWISRSVGDHFTLVGCLI